jgi:SPX domain protein involved in polyphosphate accumulation
VKSKSGEIKRRLDHLRKQVFSLTQRWQLGNQKRISVRRLERFSKAEGDVLKAGEQIQSLARFVGAQRLAFVKLLKKYKKWTGSSGLKTRFEDEVLRKPHNFAQQDFGPLLEQWTDVLAAVRAPFEAGLSWKADRDGDAQQSRSPLSEVHTSRDANNASRPATEFSESLDLKSSAADLDAVYKAGSDVDVDTAFATLPLGHAAGKAAYWVHSDNIVQLHILLLQHTRLRRRTRGQDSPPTPPSSRSSRTGSAHGSTGSVSLKRDDEVTTIICDDLKDFAERHNGVTVSVLETQPGHIPEEAAATIRCSSSESEATVVVCGDHTGQEKKSPSSAEKAMYKASLKRKSLDQLFPSDHTESLPLRSVSFGEEHNSPTPPLQSGTRDYHPVRDDINSVRRWLQEHRNIQPLTHLRCTRSRFVGLGNNSNKGVWASLDKNVYMKKSSPEDLKDFSKSSICACRASITFPYAVLEVRWEGGPRPELVKALDDTHLTERVRSFSLETHAIFALCQPPNMAAPYWLPALHRDIRKLPPPALRPKSSRQSSVIRISTEAALTGLSSPSPTTSAVEALSSSGGFSAVPQPESPATSVPDLLEVAPLKAFRKKRRTRKDRPLYRQAVSPNRSRQRYWNEFDDGAEAPPGEAYTIFVDPNASFSFPGTAMVSKLVSATFERVSSWLGRVRPSNNKNADDERRPLIDDYFTQRPTAEDSTLDSDADSDDTSAANSRHRRRYLTFLSTRHHVPPPALASRENLLFRCCIGSFIASLTFLVIASVLTITTRRRYVVTADIGTLVGVVSSLVFATVAVGMMVGRKDDVGLVHRTGVLLAFTGVCVGNAVLIAVVAGFL